MDNAVIFDSDVQPHLLKEWNRILDPALGSNLDPDFISRAVDPDPGVKIVHIKTEKMQGNC